MIQIKQRRPHLARRGEGLWASMDKESPARLLFADIPHALSEHWGQFVRNADRTGPAISIGTARQ